MLTLQVFKNSNILVLLLRPLAAILLGLSQVSSTSYESHIQLGNISNDGHLHNIMIKQWTLILFVLRLILDQVLVSPGTGTGTIKQVN